MKASETTLQPIIEGNKQYVVPLFQRPYSWERKQWQVLWDDLMELQEADLPRNHFVGAIVTMQTNSVPEGVPKYLLIDGQQRLTTLFILLTLLRDVSKARGEEELAEEIERTLLVNPYRKQNDYFKLLPTQADRGSFQGLILAPGSTPNDRFGGAYAFFEKRFHESRIDGSTLKALIVERLSVVSITLDRDDNPYLVFESLNAKGEPLTQADLIRNFFLLKIHADRQEEMHGRYWVPMQDALGDQLTDFIRHHLMKDGSFVRNDAVYFTLKERLGQGDASAYLVGLSRSAEHYHRLLRPAAEPDPAIRTALQRLEQMSVTTAFPFLLCCYDEHDRGELSAGEFAGIIGLIENFMVRRFVCGIPTNQLNKIMPPLYNQIKNGGDPSLAEGVRRVLSGRGYPKDAEFRSRLIDSKLYGGGDRIAKTRLILESIERSFGHKEAVPSHALNIEHVMPQTLTDSWRAHLGEDWEVTHELLLHTLGNLTLTGYNPELSNADFQSKRDLLRKSHVQLNDDFGELTAWTGEEIERRAEKLADVALGIWPYFGAEPPDPGPDNSTKGRPRSLRILDRVVPVESWRDVLETTLNTLGEGDPGRLESIAREMPRLVGPDQKAFRKSSRQLSSGLFVNVNLSAKDIKRLCLRALEVAELAPEAWFVELE